MSKSDLSFKWVNADFKVNTEIVDKAINQTVEDFRGGVTRKIIDTQEEHVRLALISLGWTPPEGNE